MKFFKKCSQLRIILSVILVISMMSQSVVIYAEESSGSESGGYGSGPTDLPTSSDGSGSLVSGEGWLVSIQETANTAYGNNSTYNECDVSLASAWLYNFPDCYVYDTYNNVSKYAFIGNDSTRTTTSYYIANPNPSGRTSKAVNSYRAWDYTNPSREFWKIAMLLENSGYYDSIITGLQSYSVTADYVIEETFINLIRQNTGKSLWSVGSFFSA